jgi:Spy/CpxP family protein refolding chaperone
MTSLRFRFLVAALAVTLGAAIGKAQTAESAAPAPPPPMHGPGFGVDHHIVGFYAKVLGITDEQQTQMKSVLQKERGTIQPLREQERQLDQQLHQFAEGTYDAAKVGALVAQQSQTLVQLKVEETRIHNELYQLLTPEQQAKLKEFEAGRKARMQQRFQNASETSESQQ